MTDFSRRAVLAASTSVAALAAFDAPAFAQAPASAADPRVCDWVQAVRSEASPSRIRWRSKESAIGTRRRRARCASCRRRSPHHETAPYAAGSVRRARDADAAAARRAKNRRRISRNRCRSCTRRSLEVKTGSEDCLFLNLWTPFATLDDRKKQRPVMVWLHGGGFAYGSGAWPSYDGANLAMRGDVVVVTLNHRLNLHSAIWSTGRHLRTSGLRAVHGNAGMLDMVLALEWVRDNIAAFGGDPSNVTIFGESGGGAKVSTLMAMPSAKGLFHKAIVESGPGLKGVPKRRDCDVRMPRPSSPSSRSRTSRRYKPHLAADIIKLFRLLPSQFATAGAGRRTAFPLARGRVWRRPARRSVRSGQRRACPTDVPLIIGTNKDAVDDAVCRRAAGWFGNLTEGATRRRGHPVDRRAERAADPRRAQEGAPGLFAELPARRS